MAQLYKITNVKNSRAYIGIVVASNKDYLIRFAEHLSGEGSVWIKRELDDKTATESDFKVELLEEHDDVRYIADREIDLIQEHRTLYPNGYNGNIGNYIIRNQETNTKAGITRSQNRALGKHKSTGQPGKAIYRYPTGETAKLPIDHADVTSGLVKHVNYKPTACQRIRQEQINLERQRNGGWTDKELVEKERRSKLWKHVHHTDWWQKGRETYRNRMSRGEYTDAELATFGRRSEIVAKEWSDWSAEDRLARTKNGLNIMNSMVSCEHCGLSMNKGNYRRWHGLNCKQVKI